MFNSTALSKQILLAMASAFLIRPNFMQWRRFIHKQTISIKCVFNIEFTLLSKQPITDAIYYYIIVTIANHHLK
jgi:hypothetical protein